MHPFPGQKNNNILHLKWCHRAQFTHYVSDYGPHKVDKHKLTWACTPGETRALRTVLRMLGSEWVFAGWQGCGELRVRHTTTEASTPPPPNAMMIVAAHHAALSMLYVLTSPTSMPFSLWKKGGGSESRQGGGGAISTYILKGPKKNCGL